MYKLASLFDGSGGFPLAGTLCGIRPVWASEVEPYPIAVTRERFPGMAHKGDISKINGAEVEPVDIITFGSPCQDLSVAGKRAGLKHTDNGDEETTRSGLFMEAVRIIKEMRAATNGKYPRFALWENVPGAFSSNKGEDFRIVLEELIKVVEPDAVMPPVPSGGWAYADSYSGDGWSLAYRVFDAQYWGVPQRRRRIHLVVDFTGQCAEQVLFERQGVRGYFETSRAPWQATTGDAEGGAGADDREGEVNRGDGGRGLDAVGFLRQLGGVEAQEEVSPTLMAAAGMSGNNKPCVAYTPKIRSGCEGGGKGALIQTDVSATLATNNDQYLFQPTAGILDSIGGQAERGWEGSVSPTLKATHYKCPPCIAVPTYAVENHPADSRVNIDDSGKVQTLTSRMGTGGGNVPMVMEPVVYDGAGVTSPINASNPQPGDPCHTLSTDSRNLLVACSAGFKPSQGAKAQGIGYEEEVSPTLLAGQEPGVVYATDIGFFSSAEGKAFTLNARDYKAPLSVAFVANQRDEVRIVGDKATALQAQPGMKQQTFIAQPPRYIVRRLTPTECARLQGFPDAWGHIPERDSLTDEECTFWQEVRDTYAAINGKPQKDYTPAQLLTWYNKLHTDSAEYKMWGNGIALPPALYCMQGMVDALNTPSEDDWMD